MPNRENAAKVMHSLALPAVSGSEGLDIHVDFLSNPRDLSQYAAEMDTLAAIPCWLETLQVPKGWIQRTILLRFGSKLQAVLFLLEQTIFGIPTGYFRGGDSQGETLILCDPAREQRLLALALDRLLRSHRAFLVLLDRPSRDTSEQLIPLVEPHLQIRTVPVTLHWQLPLQTTFDASIARFGHRTRRNLRYALRCVNQKSWNFLPTMTPQQIAVAISELASTSTHPFPRHVKASRLSLSAATPGSFAMGLTDPSGRWLSCLIGRRTPTATEVFWQSNACGHHTVSLCTTMRSLFMREEIKTGAGLVQYIGGTTSLMQHCCAPTQALQTSIGRPGLRLRIARLLAGTRLPSANHPLRKHL